MIWGKRVLAAVSFLLLVPVSIVSCGGAQPGGESAELKRVAANTQVTAKVQENLVTCDGVRVTVTMDPTNGENGARTLRINVATTGNLTVGMFRYFADSDAFQLATREEFRYAGIERGKTGDDTYRYGFALRSGVLEVVKIFRYSSSELAFESNKCKLNKNTAEKLANEFREQNASSN